MAITTKPKLFSEPYILNKIKSFQCYTLNPTISILVLSVLLESTVKIKQESGRRPHQRVLDWTQTWVLGYGCLLNPLSKTGVLNQISMDYEVNITFVNMHYVRNTLNKIITRNQYCSLCPGVSSNK